MLPLLPAYLGACLASEAPAWTPRPSTWFSSKACYLLCRDKVRSAEIPEDFPNTERLSVHSQIWDREQWTPREWSADLVARRTHVLTDDGVVMRDEMGELGLDTGQKWGSITSYYFAGEPECIKSDLLWLKSDPSSLGPFLSLSLLFLGGKLYLKQIELSHWILSWIMGHS